MKPKYQVNDTVYIQRPSTRDECMSATVMRVVVDEPDSIVYVLDTNDILLEKNIHASEYKAHLALLRMSTTNLGSYVSILEESFQNNKGQISPGLHCISDSSTGLWRTGRVTTTINPEEVVHTNYLQASVYGINVIVDRIHKQLEWLKDN